MDTVSPFAWTPGTTVKIIVTGAASIDQINTRDGVHMRRMRVVNVGPSAVFIETGGSAVGVSATNGLYIRADTDQVLTLSGTYLAAIADNSGTATLYVTPGEGNR